MTKRKKKSAPVHMAVLTIVVVVSLLVSLTIIVLLLPMHKGSFDRLSQVSAYAQMVKEYPTIDNTNWLNPDYTSYYQSEVPTFFDTLLMKLHLKKQPAWSLRLFEDLLADVSRNREERKLSGVCVQLIEPRENDRYFLWTDLQGAFHSLVRCLEYLKEQNVIDENLKIQDGCYFIFNGNVFDYGPIIMQTFTLVLQLMQMNPEQVFFVRSYHEQPGGWYDTKIAKQLHILGNTASDEAVPYAQEIDTFLTTLPDVIFLAHAQGDTYQAIEVTYAPQSEDVFVRECSSATVISSGGKSQVGSFDKEGRLDDKKIEVRAIIMKPMSIQGMLAHPDGLRPLGTKKDVFEWLTFSSPNGRSHQIYQYFFDTILEIDTQGPIDTWTITEYVDDVRDRLGFSMSASYYLVNGRRPGDDARIAKLQEQIEKTKQELEAAQRKCAEA